MDTGIRLPRSNFWDINGLIVIKTHEKQFTKKENSLKTNHLITVIESEESVPSDLSRWPNRNLFRSLFSLFFKYFYPRISYCDSKSIDDIFVKKNSFPLILIKNDFN